MTTQQIVYNRSASNLNRNDDLGNINLVVTSPPYPMVEMWDECFSLQNPKVKYALDNKDYDVAFEEMHKVLDSVWENTDKYIPDGGVVCINIGDATRNCNGRFKMFSNHARIIQKFLLMGYDVLPDIHWHKPTNAPNKFMGSGMLPPCAYVTYEHEYILVFRKGTNRVFTNEQKLIRQESAYFWEERNKWFSDLWELNGTSQNLKKKASRERSAAFPFELAYRLINMYSIKGDTVYDPFVGTGTVLKAAMASCRNGIGAEIDKDLCSQIIENIFLNVEDINNYISSRIDSHLNFIYSLPEEKKEKLYSNTMMDFDMKVKTRQEKHIAFDFIEEITKQENRVICSYFRPKIK